MDEYIDFIKEEGKGDIIKYLSSHLYLVVLIKEFLYITHHGLLLQNYLALTLRICFVKYTALK